MSSGTSSVSRAIPALPGALHRRSTRGLAPIFHASACSRPPDPSRRMFIQDHAKVDVGCRAANAYTKTDAEHVPEHVHGLSTERPDIPCFGIFQASGYRA